MNFFWSRKKLIEAHEKELSTLLNENAKLNEQCEKLLREMQRLVIDNSLMQDKLERFTAPSPNQGLEDKRQIEGKILGVEALVRREIEDLRIDLARRVQCEVEKLSKFLEILSNQVSGMQSNKKEGDSNT